MIKPINAQGRASDLKLVRIKGLIVQTSLSPKNRYFLTSLGPFPSSTLAVLVLYNLWGLGTMVLSPWLVPRPPWWPWALDTDLEGPNEEPLPQGTCSCPHLEEAAPEPGQGSAQRAGKTTMEQQKETGIGGEIPLPCTPSSSQAGL